MTSIHRKSEIAGWGILVYSLVILVLFGYSVSGSWYCRVDISAPTIPWKQYNPDEIVGFTKACPPEDRELAYAPDGVSDLGDLTGESLADVRENVCYFLNSIRVKSARFNILMDPYNSGIIEDTIKFTDGSTYTPDIIQFGDFKHWSRVTHPDGLPGLFNLEYYDGEEYGILFGEYLTGEIPSSDLREFAEAKQLEYEQMKKEIVEQRVNYLLGLLGL